MAGGPRSWAVPLARMYTTNKPIKLEGPCPPALLILRPFFHPVGLEVQLPQIPDLSRSGEHGFFFRQPAGRPYAQVVGPGHRVFFCSFNSARPRSTSSSSSDISRPKPREMAAETASFKSAASLGDKVAEIAAASTMGAWS